MECKCGFTTENFYRSSELIETLWNVNTILTTLFIGTVPELIETLWNVNYFIFGNFIKGDRELIETLWNVNNKVFCKGKRK